jgi:iron complex transport system ATP-binding protein
MAELSFDHVSVGYNGTPLIEDVTLEVDRGEIVALVGPNGAGKSTILKTAAGLLRPVKGSVLLGERRLSEYSLSEKAKRMSVMMTERTGTEYMTCFDVVRIGRYQYTNLMGSLSDHDREVILDSMQQIGVDTLADTDYSTLSDGQKQRVLLARAIVSEPDILILDEPTSYLDMGYKTEFFDILRQLVEERQIAVLISMHELELVKRVADRVVCISKENRVDRTGVPGEILTAEYMEKLFSMKPGKYQEYYGVE